MSKAKWAVFVVIMATLVLGACGQPAPPTAGQLVATSPPVVEPTQVAAPTAVPAEPTQVPVATEVAPSTDTVRALARIDNVEAVRQGGSTEAVPVPDRVFLNVGDGVNVDLDGQAVLRFADAVEVLLSRNGDMLVTDFNFADQDPRLALVARRGTSKVDITQRIDVTVDSDFAQITATGTSFLLVKEADSPLEWVVGLDAGPDDLKVMAWNDPDPGNPTVKGVETGVARWIAPVGVPSAGIPYDAVGVTDWLDRLEAGQSVEEIGEVLWPQADITTTMAGMEAMPAPAEQIDMQSIGLTLDPEGVFGAPSYGLQDCNGDGVQDIVVQGGTVKLDFRNVLARVRNVDVTVFNRDEGGNVSLVGRDPATEALNSAALEPGQTQCQVLSLRSDLPYHYADLSAGNACLLGVSLTPPAADGQVAAPRAAVPDCQGGGLLEPPTAAPSPTPQPTEPPAPAYSAEISDIYVADGRYVVSFQTTGFQPQLPGQHVHFFYDTVPPEEAGMPGSGPWILYGGPSPFTEYSVASRPAGATQMCILVANPDHSVIPNTGNCYDLP